MAKLLFYDTETTGLKYWKNGIHQLSGIIEVNGEVKETFNIKMAPNPSAEISDEALKIAGVTREMIASYGTGMRQGHAQFLKVISKYVNKFDKSDKLHLAGYNNRGFDDPFLRAWFTQCDDKFFGSWFWSDSIDVMVLASDKMKDQRSSMKDFKLSTVAETLGVVVDPSKLHDALYDVELTRDIYHKL